MAHVLALGEKSLAGIWRGGSREDGTRGGVELLVVSINFEF